MKLAPHCKSTIHSFNKYVLITLLVPGDIVANKSNKVLGVNIVTQLRMDGHLDILGIIFTIYINFYYIHFSPLRLTFKFKS